MITLRPDQLKLKNDILSAWQSGARNVLAVLPTGGGKSVVFADIVHDGNAVGMRQCVIAHRRELVSQMSLHIARRGVMHRVVAPRNVISQIIAEHRRELDGRSFISPTAICSVAGVDTLVARQEQLQPWADTIDRWVVDEAQHVCQRNKWGIAIEMFRRAHGLGVTATPTRADGMGLGRHADGVIDAMVRGPGMRELIDMGALTDFEIVVPASDFEIDESAVSASGDFSPQRMAEASKRSHIVGDVVQEYQRYAPGKRGITFATDVETAHEMAKRFVDAGVRAIAISAKTADNVRNEMIRRFRVGLLDMLVNVDLFGEGFDVPAVEVVIMARPTASLGVYLQQFGRALRSMPGKNCVARGTLILTQHGLVPIEDICYHHQVWDGENFVSHGGAVCRGIKNVIEYAGLFATHDHKVWTRQGWRTFGDCAIQQIPISQTGLGGSAIRECDNLFSDSVLEKEKNVCVHQMHNLQSKNRNTLYKFNRRANQGMQSLQSTNSLSALVLPSDYQSTATMRESKQQFLYEIWRSWNKIQFCFSYRSSTMDQRQSGNTGILSRTAVGSNRKRWSLRTWKHSLVNTVTKLFTYSKETSSRRSTQISSRLSSYSLCGQHTKRDVLSKYDSKRNHREMVSAVPQTKREVWDILDCGPLSRFTAQGLLVHNCGLVIDHVSNWKRHGLPDRDRVWSLDRRDKRSKRERDPEEIPLTVCRECMRPYERVLPACPHCGAVIEISPEGRRSIETVEGDLILLDRARLAELRQAVILESPAAVADRVGYAAGPIAAKGALNNQIERIQTQQALKDAIAQWAGIQRHRGRDDSESYRRFWHAAGVDVLTALTLPRAEMQTLIDRISRWNER